MFVVMVFVDMYVKCGVIMIVRKVFDMMSECYVMIWNVMIDGYGMYGIGKVVLELFEEM